MVYTKRAINFALKPPEWGPIGEQVYNRTYSRPKPDGSKESWLDTVNRVVDGNVGLVDKKFLIRGEADTLKDLIYNSYLMPAGRHLWVSGVPGRQFVFNCHHAGWAEDVIKHYSFTFDELMKGGGVGANFSNRFIKNYPAIKNNVYLHLTCDPAHKDYKDIKHFLSDKFSSDWPGTIRVADSREGWVEALESVMECFWLGKDQEIALDASLIRPKGALIRGFGGESSGPEALLAMLTEVALLLNSLVGKNLTSLDHMTIDHKISECVIAGNIRRSARISVKHWKDSDIFDFITCKSDQTKHWTTNISVEIDNAFFKAYRKKDEYAHAVYNKVVECMLTNGEPGFWNYSLSNVGEISPVTSTNPCVSGDTLVATADGRGSVPIKQLAEEDRDVPVYCLDGKGKTAIRYMRHPRITGYKKALYKVTLDDGSSVKATDNHKFILSSGEQVEVKNLKEGDSLSIMTKKEASFGHIWKSSKYAPNQQKYCWVNNPKFSQNIQEHRLIVQFFNGQIPKGYVVHHRDYNALNNRIENLQVMTKEEHYKIHSKNMLGDKNPTIRLRKNWTEEQWKQYRSDRSEDVKEEKNNNYSGYTNEDLKQLALQLAKSLGRRFSTEEWGTFAGNCGAPVMFSKWRRDHLGGIVGLSKWAALELGYDNVDCHPKTLRNYKKFLDVGYNAFIRNDTVFVLKNCEVCGCSFEVEGQRREQGICSTRCTNVKNYPERKAKLEEGRLKKYTPIREELKKKQVEVYLDLKFETKSEVMKQDWVNACKEKDVSIAISRKSSPFRLWSDLKEAASLHNHRVVSVEFDSYEDVYNGTVDEFHNFFAGGFESENKKTGIKSTVYCAVRQCGEIGLQEWEACNLGHVNLGKYANHYEKAQNAFKLMTRFLIRATFSNIYNPLQKEVQDRNRRIGVGFLGFQEWLVMQGVRYSECHHNTEIKSMLNAFYAAARSEARDYAFQLRIPEPVKVTTVAPTGTIAKLSGTTEGCQAIYGRYFVRRVQYSNSDKELKKQIKAGYKTEKSIYSKDTTVVEFPCKDILVDKVEKAGLDVDLIEQQDEISMQDSLAVQAMIQKEYADNSISFTISLPPNTVSVEDAKKTIIQWLPHVKGTTLFIDDSREQSPYTRMTEEEYETYGKKQKQVGQGIGECANGACPIK